MQERIRKIHLGESTPMTHKEICIAYLRHYAAKNLEAISEQFAEDIVLRDWKILVKGKPIALKETQKNFDAVNSIEINILEMYENKNTIAAELEIIIDDSEKLYVVDVITLDADSKINSIRAYLGRGNDPD